MTYIYTRIYKDTVAILASIGIIYLVALLGWGGVGWGGDGWEARQSYTVIYFNISSPQIVPTGHNIYASHILGTNTVYSIYFELYMLHFYK